MADLQPDRGLFSSLFDLDFRSFITVRFLRVIYLIAMTLIGLSALVFFIAFASRGGGGVLFALVVVPLFALFYLVLVRVGLELVAVLFRIADDTARIAAALAGARPGAGTPPYTGYAPGPPAGYGPPGPPSSGYGPPGPSSGGYGPPGPPPSGYGAVPPTDVLPPYGSRLPGGTGSPPTEVLPPYGSPPPGSRRVEPPD